MLNLRQASFRRLRLDQDLQARVWPFSLPPLLSWLPRVVPDVSPQPDAGSDPWKRPARPRTPSCNRHRRFGSWKTHRSTCLIWSTALVVNLILHLNIWGADYKRMILFFKKRSKAINELKHLEQYNFKDGTHLEKKDEMQDLGSRSSCLANSRRYWMQMDWWATCSMAENFSSIARFRQWITWKTICFTRLNKI